MTYTEDVLRLKEQEVFALRNKIRELEAKNEILNQQILQWQQEK
tara:strand:- start:526 stop:657 length:132 start_codon:yes stop_codon:yes gene_type:complete